LPFASVVAVTVAVLVLVRVTVTPCKAIPEPTEVTVPDMLYVGAMLAVKFTPGIFAPLTVWALLVGLNVKPVLLGVTL
jgi:hypothetical protein